MDLLTTYRRTVAGFADRAGQVGTEHWTAGTPCADWDVRTLLNHVVGEERWSVPLFAGASLAEVGDRFAGDLLGADPAASARDAAEQACRAVGDPAVLDRTVQLSAGPTPGREYLHQLLAEHLVHGWDLAVAIGVEPRLDPAGVRECARWFTERRSMYRESGLTAADVPVPPEASEQDRLVAAFGRDPGWRPHRRSPS
ncbi:TIGR03086 family metal-binding protein [Plantactinospora sp. KLBMP9567]|uniref:TIGR03086 family metal-binding protein n=1 Tax=Plantactinospora sp. KLBMP9567 TaxID=3085900 RepID=UPI002981DFDF|nr:TIGR03086 family metal-binding protein [Plantactinospora sp. KLBMP9567]MDW5326786.1 TIGR03086 family metal-binding protein [Plantactinospora sp. KLBMP9567]